MVLHGLRNMIDMNPDWTYTVYDHNDIDSYIKRELSRESPTLKARDVELVLKAHIVERTDAARLLMMWHEGGFYQDVDRLYNVPMDRVLTPEVKMVIPTLYDTNFMQDLMCTVGQMHEVFHLSFAWKW
jgi:mannosyltransferase OCH1-like enzyme